MSKHRYLPSWEFPPYVFVPGKNPHPKKSGGHWEGKNDPQTHPIQESRPFESEFLRYSLDLLNHGYFWESHVYLEALWNAQGRSGDCADFFKALIKLAAGGVKLTLAQDESARGHFKRARELLLRVKSHQGQIFLGFDLEHILGQIEESLEGKMTSFEIHPLWK